MAVKLDERAVDYTNGRFSDGKTPNSQFFVHIYIHTYIHTHTHTYIQTQTDATKHITLLRIRAQGVIYMAAERCPTGTPILLNFAGTRVQVLNSLQPAAGRNQVRRGIFLGDPRPSGGSLALAVV